MAPQVTSEAPVGGGELLFQPASDRSLLIHLGRAINLQTHERVRKLLNLLQQAPAKGITNFHPAYCSLLVTFDPLQLSHGELEIIVRRLSERIGEVPLPKSRLLEIPVCYGGAYGPDLDDVAALHAISLAQVIELHSSVTYTAYFLGFMPGFAYLGGLPERLATPRLATPRTHVPRGSVGIAGDQTGAYPFASPGGWRLIGRTPLALFSVGRTPMSLLSIGDQVRFKPISSEHFAREQEACR